MKTLREIKESAGLNNPIKHFKDRAMGIISASRGELSPEVNSARNSELHDELKDRGFNVHKAKGVYTEHDPHTNEPREVHEDSHIVSVPQRGYDSDLTYHTLMELGKKYNQETILHKPHNSDVASLHDPRTKEHFPIGVAKEGKHGPHHTELPNGKVFSFN